MEENKLGQEHSASKIFSDKSTQTCASMLNSEQIKQMNRQETDEQNMGEQNMDKQKKGTRRKRKQKKREQTTNNVQKTAEQKGEQKKDEQKDEQKKDELEQKDFKQRTDGRKKRNGRALMPEVVANNPILKKYWARRYTLFSKYDQGIQLDYESWFSVTPEMIAKHIADRCNPSDVVVDAFCGAGGNAIQFADHCKHVIGIDIDPEKLALAKHNAEIYGVAQHITFIQGDYFVIAPKLRADVVFLSPPWGGPDYDRTSPYKLDGTNGLCGVTLISQTRKITDNIIMYLPRTTSFVHLLGLARSGDTLEIETDVLNDRPMALTAYYGDLHKSPRNYTYGRGWIYDQRIFQEKNTMIRNSVKYSVFHGSPSPLCEC